MWIIAGINICGTMTTTECGLVSSKLKIMLTACISLGVLADISYMLWNHGDKRRQNICSIAQKVMEKQGKSSVGPNSMQLYNSFQVYYTSLQFLRLFHSLF